jgi:hypothetical protein
MGAKAEGGAKAATAPAGGFGGEMIAITPPNIFSKEVAHKQATPLTAPATSLTTKNRFTPSFRGWRLDENLKLKSPPYRGSSYRGSAARQNEVAPRGSYRRLMPRTRPGASILHCGRDALHAAALLPLRLCKKSA